jgi:hypothetical protein
MSLLKVGIVMLSVVRRLKPSFESIQVLNDFRSSDSLAIAHGAKLLDDFSS